MSWKSICIALILTAALVLGFASVPPVSAQTSHGPRSPELNLYYFTDETSLYSAFKAGQIDLSLWEATSAQYRDAITDPNIIMSPVSRLDMFAFSLNNNETIASYPGVRICTSYADFRKALWCMVDRAYYIEVICGGFATPVYVPVAAPSREWVDTTVEDWVKVNYAYNIQTASNYLDAGGFLQRSGANDLNPYYSTVPGSARYWRGYPTGHSKQGQRIDPVVFSARVDDGLRFAASVHLRDRMLMSGIPVNFIAEPSSSAFLRVMTARNYQIYSAGWSVGKHATYEYDWLHTCRWMRGGSNFHISPTSPGYTLETNPAKRPEDIYDLDFWASQIWYGTPPTLATAIAAAKAVQSLACMTYGTFIPLWSSRAFFYYRNLYGVTNMDGTGIENIYTFLSAWRADGGTTLRVGHKSPPTMVNQIYSSWPWDITTMGFTQDEFISLEPYNLFNEQPWLAQDWSNAPISTTNSPSSTPAGTWVSPSLAYVSDDLYTTTSNDNATQEFGKYGFTIPAGNIERVEVGIEAHQTGEPTDKWNLNVTVSWDNGVSWVPERKLEFLGTQDPPTVEWIDFTLARNWMPSDFSNINFRVRARAIRDKGTGGAVFLDWIPVRVHYCKTAMGSWIDPDDKLTKSMIRFWFRDDPNDGLGDSDSEWIEPQTGNVLNDFTSQWLGGGYRFNCWYYDAEPAGWIFTNYRDIKHIICNSVKKFAEVYFDGDIFWSQYSPYGRLIYAPLGVPGPGQFKGWKQQPLTTTETRTFTGPISTGTFLNTLVPLEGAAKKIPTRARGSPVEIIELTRNDSVPMTEAATPQSFDPATGLGASGDYSIVGSSADGPRIRIYQNIPSNVKLTVKYWGRGDPAGYWPGNTNFQTTLAGTGPFYMTSFLAGAGGYATYKANPHYFMEAPLKGEIDWYYVWIQGRVPRDGYYVLDLYDAAIAGTFAMGGTGSGLPPPQGPRPPTRNWVPSSDLTAPLGETDINDLAILACSYSQTFGSPPPNPPP